MTFDHIVGNEQVKKQLTTMLKNGRLGNSLLFSGPDGIGKNLFAQAIAHHLLSQDDPAEVQRCKLEANCHPDLHILRPEGKLGMHSIDSLRQMTEEVYMAPFEANHKVFIIHHADRMLSYSANALLKTFEEPSKDSLIILLSASPQSLLPTIISRCRTLRFHALTNSEIAAIVQKQLNLSNEEALGIAAMSAGSAGNAIHFAQHGGAEMRKCLLNLLAGGGVRTYHELTAVAKTLAQLVEEAKKQEEELVRKELGPTGPTELTALQKQFIEKEVDGAIAMRLSTHAQALFEIILSWYRDMELVRFNGNHDHLINRDYFDSLQQAVQRGEELSLDSLQESIVRTKLALDRSTSLQICLENLLLQLPIASF